MANIDFTTPSEDALKVYYAVIEMMRQKDKSITISANKEGGSTLFHKDDHMLYKWEEWGYEKGEQKLDVESDRARLMELLYLRAISFERAAVPIETALLRYLSYYKPESKLLEGKPDPGVL